MLAPTLNPCQPSCAPYKLCAPYAESYSRPSLNTPSVKSVLKQINEYVNTREFANIYTGQVFTGDDLRDARVKMKSHFIYCEVLEVFHSNLPQTEKLNICNQLTDAIAPENDRNVKETPVKETSAPAPVSSASLGQNGGSQSSGLSRVYNYLMGQKGPGTVSY